MKQEHLIAAKALIDKPEKWTQGGYARNTKGHVVGLIQLKQYASAHKAL